MVFILQMVLLIVPQKYVYDIWAKEKLEIGDDDVLETVKQDAIGKDLTLIKSGAHMFIVSAGDTKISETITFLDSNNLQYKQSQYEFTLEGAGPHWEERKNLQEATFPYEFTKNKRDGIFLTFNNVTYTVNVDYNDNTIANIVKPN